MGALRHVDRKIHKRHLALLLTRALVVVVDIDIYIDIWSMAGWFELS